MQRRFLATYDKVAAAISEGRAAAGLSQWELAAKAGVDPSFVVDIEAGEHRLELDKILKTLSVLDIHATALPSPPVTGNMHKVDLDAVLARYA